MSEPLISVLMTSYNREKYIAFAIESVLASTLKDLELIIVDDGSKDSTVAIAKKYQQQDPRVKVHENAVNLGDYPNRNRAASFATGKYLKYVDSDDFIYPWALERMYTEMEKFPEAGWGLCSMEPYIKKPFPFLLTPKEIYEYHYFGPGLFRRAPLSSIIRRDVFVKEGGFKPIRMSGDFEMWQRLAQRYSVVLMPEGMVWYRTHDNQEVKDYSDFINVYEKIKIDYLDAADCPLDKITALQIRKQEKQKTVRNIATNIFRLDFKTLKINLRNLRLYK